MVYQDALKRLHGNKVLISHLVNPRSPSFKGVDESNLLKGNNCVSVYIQEKIMKQQIKFPALMVFSKSRSWDEGEVALVCVFVRNEEAVRAVLEREFRAYAGNFADGECEVREPSSAARFVLDSAGAVEFYSEGVTQLEEIDFFVEVDPSGRPSIFEIGKEFISFSEKS